MEERFIKIVSIVVLVAFAIIAVCELWTQHEKFELLKEAIRSGNYVVENSNCK